MKWRTSQMSVSMESVREWADFNILFKTQYVATNLCGVINGYITSCSDRSIFISHLWQCSTAAKLLYLFIFPVFCSCFLLPRAIMLKFQCRCFKYMWVCKMCNAVLTCEILDEDYRIWHTMYYWWPWLTLKSYFSMYQPFRIKLRNLSNEDHHDCVEKTVKSGSTECKHQWHRKEDSAVQINSANAVQSASSINNT